MTRSTGKHLTRQQIVQIGVLLQAKCKPSKEGKGLYEYIDDFSDAKMAEQFNVSSLQVAKLRKDLLGDLVAGSAANNPLHHAWMRIKDIERRVEALEEAATSSGKDAKQTSYTFATRPNGL